MIKKIVKFLARLVLALVGLVGIVICCQDALIFPGMVDPLIARYTGRVKEVPPPSEVEVFRVTTADQEQLEVWKLPKPLGLPDRGVVLLLHGNGGTVRNFFSYQLALQKFGFSTYSFDYRGFGSSTGWPSELGIYQDAEAVWKFILQREKIGAQDMQLFGISIGTAPASYLAAQHNPAALVLISPFSSLPDVVALRPLYKYLKSFLWYTFPTETYVSKLTNTCLVIAHGELDLVVPVDLSLKVEKAYQGKKSITRILSSESGHNDIFFVKSKEIMEAFIKCTAKSSAEKK